MPGNENTGALIQNSIGDQFTQDSKVHINLAQDVIVITEDRFRLCLIGHTGRLAARERWIAPVSLFATFIVVFSTAEFRPFVFPAATWQAVFVICACASLVWSVVAVIKAVRTDTKLDTLVSEVKKSSAKS